MATIIDYLQGDTIEFYIEGKDGVDLDAMDFEVLHYTGAGTNKNLLSKDELTFVSANKYKGTIANTVTKTMAMGLYVIEVLAGTTKTKVLQGDAFNLGKSQIKSEIA